MNFKKLFFFGFSIIALQIGVLEGLCCVENMNFELQLESGYRLDRIEETVETIDTARIVPYSSTETRYRGLSSAQLGGRGYVSYCNWVIKGIGHYGWILDGRFDEDRALDGKDVCGNTYDGLAGLGYTYCVCDCFAVTPLVGYSYDHQQVKVHKLVMVDPAVPPNTINRVNYHASWFGPWVGFDICYEAKKWCGDLSFNAGYEFHYARAHTNTKETLTTGSFGFHTKQKDMLGHVFRLDTQLHLGCDWYGGLNQTYAYWENKHRSRVHFDTGTVTGLTATQVSNVNILNWYSYCITASLSKVF